MHRYNTCPAQLTITKSDDNCYAVLHLLSYKQALRVQFSQIDEKNAFA